MVHSNRVSPLVASRMSPLLAFQTQVDFAGLAPHGGPLPRTWRMPVGALAGVTVRDMASFESYPLVVSKALLPVQFLLTAETLQTTTLITFEDGFVSPAAGIALLAQEARIQALLRWGSLGTHNLDCLKISPPGTLTTILSQEGWKTKALSLKVASASTGF